jgi:PGF-CTERM protein
MIRVGPLPGDDRFVDETKTRTVTVTNDETVTVELTEAGGDDGGGGGGGGGDGGDPTVTAAIAANQTEAFPGEIISFDASASEGTNLAYNWTFGDGANATGETVEHAYDAAGAYNVSLTVANESASDTTEITVDVVNPVTAALAANQSGVYPGEPISFNASASEGTDLAYNWTFGDDTNATGETVEHTYDATGTYNVTLTVANGSASDTDRIAVSVVEPVDAAITAERTSASVGDIIEFDALNSTSEARSANVTYEWDFGDGTTVTDGVVAHEYDATGTYTVTLTATDTVTGETTTDTVEVVIEEGSTNDGVPGFGPLVALIALLVSAFVARLRD